LKDSVGLAEMDALKLSQSLMKTSPSAFENFKISYEYAISPAGLGTAKDQAIQLGKKMADFTVKNSKSTEIK